MMQREEKKEFVLRCQRCGGKVHFQGTKEELEEWLETEFGICPAGGSHVELGSKESYLTLVEETRELTQIPSKADILQKLLAMVEDRQAILIVGLDNPEIPDIHSFYPERYSKSIKHLGFGCFKGRTESGKFSFDAGGAMKQETYQEGKLSWTRLIGSPQVLEDLEYNFQEVARELQQEIPP